MTAETAKPKVFISYSHKDVAWKERVLEHLRVLENAGELAVWDDQRINAGDEWRAEIETAMQSAAVALLLVSTDFLNSAFIRGTEIPRLLARRQDQGLRIIPVFVRPCAWKAMGWLAALQGRPRNGKTLADLRRHQADSHLAELALEVGELLGRALSKQVATEPQAGVDLPQVGISVSDSLTLRPTGSGTYGSAAFTPASPEPAALLAEALRDRESSLDLQRTSDKAAPPQTGAGSLLVSDPRSVAFAPHLAGPETDEGSTVSAPSEPGLLDEALRNSEPSSELRRDSNTAGTPQSGSPVGTPRSESPAPLPAGTETERGPAPAAPDSPDETLRRRDPGLEIRRARKKAVIAFTMSLFGLLSNVNFLSDYHQPGYKLFVLGIVTFFSLGGIGLGIAVNKDLDRLKARRVKGAVVLAVVLGWYGLVIAFYSISIF